MRPASSKRVKTIKFLKDYHRLTDMSQVPKDFLCVINIYKWRFYDSRAKFFTFATTLLLPGTKKRYLFKNP